MYGIKLEHKQDGWNRRITFRKEDTQTNEVWMDGWWERGMENGHGSGITSWVLCLFRLLVCFLAFEAWRFAVSCLYVCVIGFNPMGP